VTYKFTCPDCGENKLEEIMSSVTVASEISVIQDGDLEYGEQTNSSGVVERYQCANCGYTVAHSPEELVEMLEVRSTTFAKKEDQ